jgi:F-type H+-transporting ATPase subunit b
MIEIYPWMLLVQIANFLFMLWFLNRFVFKPILKAVDERESKFKGLDRDGKALLARGEQALTDYEKKLAQLRHDSAEVTATARKEAQEASLKIIDEAKNSFKQTVDKARSDIATDAQAAGAAIKKEVSLFAGLIASKIMGRDVK